MTTAGNFTEELRTTVDVVALIKRHYVKDWEKLDQEVKDLVTYFVKDLNGFPSGLGFNFFVAIMAMYR